mgnify:CR=1 FL=1
MLLNVDIYICVSLTLAGVCSIILVSSGENVLLAADDRVLLAAPVLTTPNIVSSISNHLKSISVLVLASTACVDLFKRWKMLWNIGDKDVAYYTMKDGLKQIEFELSPFFNRISRKRQHRLVAHGDEMFTDLGTGKAKTHFIRSLQIPYYHL